MRRLEGGCGRGGLLSPVGEAAKRSPVTLCVIWGEVTWDVRGNVTWGVAWRGCNAPSIRIFVAPVSRSSPVCVCVCVCEYTNTHTHVHMSTLQVLWETYLKHLAGNGGASPVKPPSTRVSKYSSFLAWVRACMLELKVPLGLLRCVYQPSSGRQIA